MLLPALYSMYDSYRANREFKDLVKRMFLLKNGDQIVCETFDGLMHKMNISLNTEYEIKVKKGKELVWIMSNCKRDFFLSNKDAHYVDYDLIDKIIHAVPVDTVKHLSLYHNLIYKRYV